jgi:hypothetical protein
MSNRSHCRVITAGAIALLTVIDTGCHSRVLRHQDCYATCIDPSMPVLAAAGPVEQTGRHTAVALTPTLTNDQLTRAVENLNGRISRLQHELGLTQKDVSEIKAQLSAPAQ